MYNNNNVHVSGSVRRAAKRNVQYGAAVTVLTRAEAQARIAASSDPKEVARFCSHGNSHVQKYATHKLNLLELRARRSEAARKAAATRKAKREATAA